MRLLILIFLASCSTLKKTLIYSSFSGTLAGASAGYILSPDIESRGANAAVFGLLGAGVAAATGYALYEDDPRNQKLNHMLEPSKKQDPNKIDIDLGNIQIDANLNIKERYLGPKKELPSELKGKIKEQYIIKYESKERYINNGNKTFYIPSFKVYEHAYENLGIDTDGK